MNMSEFYSEFLFRYQTDDAPRKIQKLLPCLKLLLLKAKSVLNIDETWYRVRIVTDELMEGNKDYESLLPGKLALQAI